MHRLSASQRAQFRETLSTTYVQFERDDQGRITLRPRDVADTERPPIHDLHS
jgi:hypothetical protein